MNGEQTYPALISIGELLGALLQPVPAITDEDATVYVGMSLALSLSAALASDFDEIWRVMTHLPDGYLRLLESPEGWAALGAIVAADLGISSVPVVPAIH